MGPIPGCGGAANWADIVTAPQVTAGWKRRVQQIFPAEAVALVIATWALHTHFKHSDVTWFIDNEAAAAAGIRGASGEPDVTAIVQAAHLLWLNLGTRVWIEWIDSASNPSDGLSRAGLQDPWTLAQNLGFVSLGGSPVD